MPRLAIPHPACRVRNILRGVSLNGFEHIPAFLTDEEQFELTAALRKATAMAPLFTPRFRSGLPYLMQVTNTGSTGFIGSQTKQRFSDIHPITRRPWPSVPLIALDIASRLAGHGFAPDNGQISFYRHPADGDGVYRETGPNAGYTPLVMLSLGDNMLLRLGGMRRADPLHNHLLRSGDAVLLAPPASGFWYGTNGIQPDSCRLPLFKNGGHICLTLRCVEPVLLSLDSTSAPELSSVLY